MPLEDFLRAFDTLPLERMSDEMTVVLTGGEPLLRPDIEEIGKALQQRRVGWSMVTNGYWYSQQLHSRLMSAGLGALTISLDGLEEEHDWMRGLKGCYSRTLNAITIAVKEYWLNFDVVTCVNQRNLPQLQQIHDLLASLGVKRWRLFTIIPIGRAKDSPELHLSNNQFVQLMEFIKEKRQHKEAAMQVSFGCEGYLGKYEREVRQNPYMCHAGINIASVLIDGTICGCPNIDRQVFAQGNIYRDNLWEVWQNRFLPFRNRDWARKGQCKECKMFKNCLGNGMHNWHGDCKEVLNCHYNKILQA
jgi:radical SAM enzyme (rSAM/lipoprotein system)